MWFKKSFFKYTIGIILLLLIIFLLRQVDFILQPIFTVIAVIFIPLLTAVILYYILRPVVRLVEKFHIPRLAAIAIVMILLAAIIVLSVLYIGSIAGNELNKLITNLPAISQNVSDQINDLAKNDPNIATFTADLEKQITNFKNNFFPSLSSGLLGILSTITGILTVILIVPIMLFFFLKDDKYFVLKFISLFPTKYTDEISETIIETDKKLSAYIVGQTIIALITGVVMYAGYMFFGVKYALLLGVFALLTAFIPMFGSIIGAVPAVLVALTDSPVKAIQIIVLTVVVSQIIGNLVFPALIGKKLNIHPLAIIIVFLAAASLYGFIGVLVAVPAYAAFKVIVQGSMDLYKIYKKTARKKCED